MRIFSACIVIGALSAAPACAQTDSTCNRTGYNLGSSVRATESTMTVSRNGRCGSALNSRNISDPRIDRQATNGRVTFNGNNYVYVPNPGYTGGDRFVVSWANDTRGSRVTLTVGVRVEPPGASSAGAPSGPSSGSATRSSTGASGA